MIRQKSSPGRFFEDFSIGHVIRHATPRTMTVGDVALYQSLYGGRFALQSAETFARQAGYPAAPLDDLLVFHTVFGKTVPDISLNAIANLGYANCRFVKAVYAGETLHARSEIIGLRENANRESGVVYVRTTGFNQSDEAVLEFVRWVMVRKRDASSPGSPPVVPAPATRVSPEQLGLAVPAIDQSRWDCTLSGSSDLWDDYAVGEKIDHREGVTVEEAEHQMATRLYQNTARVHFNEHTERESRFGRRLIYGGVIISLARALSFNGLGNAFHIAAINGGKHLAPAFAGDTIYAWSEVLDRAEIPQRSDIGALRLRTFATKNLDCSGFPGSGEDRAGVILELDYWVAMPR